MFRPIPVDLEMTGLDLGRHVILEFALTLVSPDLELVADFGSRIIHATEEQLAEMDDHVLDMHTETGLLDEVRASTLSIADVDREVSTWLREHGINEPNAGIILGASTRKDLEFIERDMPLFAELLTYRMLDISAIKEALRLWAPEIEIQQPFHLLLTGDHLAHRAANDIRWTLAEAVEIRDLFSDLRPRPLAPGTEFAIAPKSTAGLVDDGLVRRTGREELNAAKIDFTAWLDAPIEPGEDATLSYAFVRDRAQSLIFALEDTLNELERFTAAQKD